MLRFDHETEYIMESSIKQKNILFVHGFASNISFINTIKNVNRDFNIIALNLPPSGRSTMPKDLLVENYASFVENFIRRKKLSNIYLVGHSFGGAVVSYLAPLQEVKRVVLVSPLHPFANFYDAKPPKRSYVLPRNLEESVQGVKALVFNKSLWTKEQIALVAKNHLSLLNSHRKQFERLFYEQVCSRQFLLTKLYAVFETSAKKLCLIAGEQDEFIVKAKLEKLTKALKIRSYFLKNCGHCPILEKPQRFLQLLKKITI